MPGTASSPVEFDLLGDLRAVVDGVEVAELGGPAPRTVLAALVAAGGRTVTADALAQAVWGDEPPPSAQATLLSHVSRLRKALGVAGAVLERRGPGYRLDAPPEAFDWWRFESLAEQGRQHLLAGDPAHARESLVAAESLWRGEPLAGLEDRPFAPGLITRLGEVRRTARADRQDAELALGRHAALLGELEEDVRARPFDEAVWCRLALARYRSGQQAAALQALADARRVLVDELGVEPGSALRELEVAVLRHDAGLDVRTLPSLPAGATRRSDVPRLVGRDDELDQLRAALRDAASRAQVVVVEGEPGIGKTRLVEEITAEAAAGGALVLWGRTHESGAAPAFWPWLPVLRALHEGRQDVPAELASLLGATAGATGLVPVLDAVTSALQVASTARQVVVVIDDLQWADSASLALVAHLTNHLSEERVLLLTTVRELEVGRDDEVVQVLGAVARRRGGRRLRLSGLDLMATAELVRATAGSEVDAAVVAAVHRRAEGNPFFATELTRLTQESGQTTASVPAGLRDVLRQRLSRLPAATTALLECCAVAGRDVDLALLPLVSGRTQRECLSDLEPAFVHRVLVEPADGAPRFAHALLREVLAEDLPATRRRGLHLAVADALEDRGLRDDDRELAAEHLWAALPLSDTVRVAAALEAAAEVAVRRFALASADSLLSRAVELRATRPHDVAEELAAVVRLLSVRRAVLGFGGVTDLLERGEALARRAGRPDVENELLWARWAVSDTACDFAVSRPLVARAKARADQGSPGARRFWLQMQAIQSWHDGDHLAARDAFDAAAEDDSPEHLTSDTAVDAFTHDTLLSFEQERLLLGAAFRQHVHDLLEDTDDAREQLDALLAHDDPFAAAMAAAFACASACAAGDDERVRKVAEQVVGNEDGFVLSFWGGHARMYLGWALARSGDVEAGLAMWRTGREIYAATGLRVGLSIFLARAAQVLISVGDLEGATALLDEARELVERWQDRCFEPVRLLAEAELHAAKGDDDAAAAAFDSARACAVAMAAKGMQRDVEATAARWQAQR